MFTLTESETDKMGLKPIGIGHCMCLGQCKHLHTILYNPFFSLIWGYAIAIWLVPVVLIFVISGLLSSVQNSFLGKVMSRDQ